MRGGSGVQRAVVVAALLAVVAVLLWRPLLRFRTHTLGPFEVMAQHTTLTWQPDCVEPTNPLLTDPAVEMHPWALFAARELHAGRLPLWNPYNGAGAPLLANYQSALLSPFTLPYYVLPTLKAAMLASGLLKLLAAGTFAYLFLCSLRCTRGAALLGGAALASSGACLVLLQHPHAGVLALLPACLYCAEVLCARCEAPAPSPRALAGAAAWLALAIGVSALAGHPEALLFSYLVVAAYSAYRAATLAAAPARRLTAAGWLLAAALTGLALGAVQTLPFAEYLGKSGLFTFNRVGNLTMVPQYWPMQFFPFISGAPPDPGFSAAFDLGAHYQDIASFFVGGVVLLCASIGVLQARVDGHARFFTALAVLWIVYAYDVFGACTWLYTHTSLGHIPVTRTQPLWTPSACFLAALGVSALERSDASAGWRRGLACLALAAALFALFHWGAEDYLDDLAGRQGRARAELDPGRHLAAMGALFALGAEGLVVIASSRRSGLRIAGYVALIASVVAGSALTLADYVPTVKDRYVYPRTEAMQSLESALGEERVVFLSTGNLPAELNLAYGVRTIESFDAVGVGDSVRLIGHFFGGHEVGAEAEPRRASKRALQLFGVSYVATRGDWVPIGTDLGDLLVTGERLSAYNAWEWTVQDMVPWPHPRRNKPLRIELEASRDGLDGVAVQFIQDPAAQTSMVTLRVIDVDQDRELARVERRLGVLPVLSMLGEGGRTELVARFDPLPESKGRKLALEISTPGERTDPRPRVLRSPWPRTERREGPIPMVDLGYDQSEFELVSRSGTNSLHRYVRSPGRAWIVGTALAAATHEEAFELVAAPAFEPLEQVVLERPSGEGATHAGPFELETQSEEPCRWRFEATCATPGWLVVAQASYPGWKARIDGEEREVLRANYALTAVELPAGEHQIELFYDPLSVRLGATCSLLAALAIATGIVFGLRGRARDTRTP